MRRTASIFAAVAIVLMAYSPVYAAGQAAEDHLCCLRQLRQEAAQAKAHCDGMSGMDVPAPAATFDQIQAAKHRCERCIAAVSVLSTPLSIAVDGFVVDRSSTSLAHSQMSNHSDAGLFEISGRGPPSHSAS